MTRSEAKFVARWAIKRGLISKPDKNSARDEQRAEWARAKQIYRAKAKAALDAQQLKLFT